MINNLPEEIGPFTRVEKSYWKEENPLMPVVMCYRAYDSKHGYPVELVVRELKHELLDNWLKETLKDAKTYTLHLDTNSSSGGYIFASNNLEEVINYLKKFAQSPQFQSLKQIQKSRF